MDNRLETDRDASWSKFSQLKDDIIVNLSYMSMVLKGLDSIKDKRLNSNKLKNKRQWLKMWY